MRVAPSTRRHVGCGRNYLIVKHLQALHPAVLHSPPRYALSDSGWHGVLPVPARQNLWNFHGCAEDDKHHCKACFCRKNHLNDSIQKPQKPRRRHSLAQCRGAGSSFNLRSWPSYSTLCDWWSCVFPFSLVACTNRATGRAALATSGLLHVVSPIFHSRVVFRGVVCIFSGCSGRKQTVVLHTQRKACTDHRKPIMRRSAEAVWRCPCTSFAQVLFRSSDSPSVQIPHRPVFTAPHVLGEGLAFASLHSLGATHNAR